MNGVNKRLALNIIPLGSYGCLIYMDWLDKYHVVLDFYNKAFIYIDEKGQQRKVQGFI